MSEHRPEPQQQHNNILWYWFPADGSRALVKSQQTKSWPSLRALTDFWDSAHSGFSGRQIPVLMFLFFTDFFYAPKSQKVSILFSSHLFWKIFQSSIKSGVSNSSTPLFFNYNFQPYINSSFPLLRLVSSLLLCMFRSGFLRGEQQLFPFPVSWTCLCSRSAFL